MKNKSQLIGIFLIICGLGLLLKINQPQAGSEKQISSAIEHVVSDDKIVATEGTASVSAEAVAKIRSKNSANEKLFTIGNDVIDVVISNDGGTIKSVTLKKYKSIQDQDESVIFNEGSNINALSTATGSWNIAKFADNGIFEVIALSKNHIKLSKNFDDGHILVREYSIAEKDGKEMDGYIVRHNTSIINGSDSSINIGKMHMFIGAMPATASDVNSDYLNFGTFDGKKDNFIKLRDFKASKGFFGLGKRYERPRITSSAKIIWGSIKNQFFTAVMTPDGGANGYVTSPIMIQDANSETLEEGISASMTFDIGILNKGETAKLSSTMYIGPKDFSRLSHLGQEQDRVMQFGFFGSISELLLRLMLKIHAVIPNWGWTIIILTTIVKLLLWPLTNAQVKSSKKMSAIQKPLKFLKEKYKNNPQKLQSETLKLFKSNRINPAAGCLPIFIQIPIFFGLYYMLRTASDLRFAHFLWIKDLSLPDTVAHIGHFPVNILPIIMGITMFFQMHMTPMPSSDGSQKLMFKLMPAIFMLCCYSLPSGLVLYWTVQNLLTIVQQFLVSRNSNMQIEIIENDAEQSTKKKKNKKQNSYTNRRK